MMAICPAATQPENLKSDHWLDDTPVLQSRSLRALPTNFVMPMFVHDLWDLRPAIHRNNANDLVGLFDFTGYTDPVRKLTVKELMMQRLNRPVPPLGTASKMRALSPVTLVNTQSHLVSVYNFMDSTGLRALREFNQGHCDQYLRRLLATANTKEYCANRAMILVWLYEFRELLTRDWIAVPPWGGAIN